MGKLIADAYAEWAADCNARIEKMRKNEEEINRIFIRAYGLEEEFTPTVADSDITLRRADLAREAKSLLSYFIGCAFGRYSLDEEGLVYAGGTFDVERYRVFPPVSGNLLPLYTGAEQSVIALLERFLSAHYGADTLKANLAFLARTLGGAGDAREVLSAYFQREFYRDHLRVYKNRPVYWLLSSGRERAFLALFYLHRYDAALLGYVHSRHVLPLLLRHEKEAAEGSTRAKKQVEELRAYEKRLLVYAKNPPSLPLDVGVSVNYALLQDILAPRKRE